MSNINQITDSEKLFVELTHEEGAAISGGAVTLRNDTNVPLNIYSFDKFFNVQLYTLPAGPGSSTDIPGNGNNWVLYDEKKGPELVPMLRELEDGGTYSFIEENDKLDLRVGFQTFTQPAV